jgi:cell division protein FtsZ
MSKRTKEKPEMSKEDEELAKIVEESRTKIKIVGAGGAGNNTVTRLMDAGITGVETIAINTDALQLLNSKAHRKLLIGKNTTRGLGAGANPQIGMEAAQESKEEIKEVLDGADLVFLTCGLGGGTGSGSLPVIAEIAKRLNALIIGVVTLPFSVEGKERMRVARETIEKLQGLVNTLIVIPNDKLLEICPEATLIDAFRICDEILINAVKGIAELITKPGIVNRDFADIKTIMSDGGLAMIGLGESNSENRAKDSVEKAIKNPLLAVDINDAKGALIHITSGPQLKINEVGEIIESISSKLSPDAKILWGATIDEKLKNVIRTLLIITGVKSPQIFGPLDSSVKKKKRSIEKDVGVELVE